MHFNNDKCKVSMLTRQFSGVFDFYDISIYISEMNMVLFVHNVFTLFDYTILIVFPDH